MSTPAAPTLLVTGGIVITMDPARRVIEHGAVLVEKDCVAAVGPAADLPSTADTVIDATGHAILPGLIDGHAHAGHGLVKTMGGGDSAAWSEACRIVYTLASPPAFWRAEARLVALERLMFGVTTGLSLLGGGDSVMRTDTPAHGDAHLEGVAEIGIRAIMAVGPTRPPFPRPYADWTGNTRTERPVSFEQQLDTIQALLERWQGRGDHRTTIATLMPVHHDSAAPAAEIDAIARQGRAVQELGRRHRAPFHQDGHRKGSLERAHRVFGLLAADGSMSHCTDLTEGDIDALAETGASVVHNPSAIASVRGYCPVPALQARGITVLLGSDGTAPDRSTDMFRHMFQCMRLHQRQHRDERLMPPGRLLEMVTIDAARGLGLHGYLGSLEPGKLADLITIDLRKPHLAPANMPVWRIVCFANGQDVSDVIVGGRVLMRNRSVPHVDIPEVLAAAEVETRQMLDRTGLHAMLAEPAAIWGKGHT